MNITFLKNNRRDNLADPQTNAVRSDTDTWGNLMVERDRKEHMNAPGFEPGVSAKLVDLCIRLLNPKAAKKQ